MPNNMTAIVPNNQLTNAPAANVCAPRCARNAVSKNQTPDWTSPVKMSGSASFNKGDKSFLIEKCGFILNIADLFIHFDTTPSTYKLFVKCRPVWCTCQVHLV